MANQSEQLVVGEFLRNHPADAARVLEAFPAPDVAQLFDTIDVKSVAEVIEQMAPAAGAECLAALRTQLAGRVIEALDFDSAAGLLRRIDPEIRAVLIEATDEEIGTSLKLLVGYPERTAGSWMDPRVLALPEDIDIAEAQERVRRFPRFTMYYVYVVDRAGKLQGVINLRELLLADTSKRLSEAMNTSVARLSAPSDRSVILAHPGWSEYHALPVVDGVGRLVGAIRYETLRRLETEVDPGHDRPVSMAVSLGELYWMGLSGVLEGLGDLVTRAPERDDEGSSDPPPDEPPSNSANAGGGREGDPR